MKTNINRNKRATRWMPLAVIAAGGCFMGVETQAQSTKGEQQKSAQSQNESGPDQQNLRYLLKQEGLSEQRVEKLSQGGFDLREVESALTSNYKEEGLSEQKARSQAKGVAQRIAKFESVGAYSQKRYVDEETAQDEVGEESWARRTAPEGAEIKDSATMVLNEEELNVQKREVPVGGIILRKKVTTDNASETVQLRSEDVEIVRLTPEEAKERQSGEYQSGFDQAFQEGEIFIPLMREEAVAETNVSTRQIVRARPEVQTEEKQFDATLRSEQVEVQRVDAPQASNGEAQTEQSYSAKQQFDSLENRIRSEIQKRVSSLDREQLEQIGIQVEQGSVTLSGSVPNEEAKQQIERVVRAMAEVEEVTNKLKS